MNVLGNDLEVDFDLEVLWRTCNSCLAAEVRCDSRKWLQARTVFPPHYWPVWTIEAEQRLVRSMAVLRQVLLVVPAGWWHIQT